MQLVRYEAARQALQEAVRIDEAKDIRDKAVALAEYARQREDAELESAMSRLKIRADIRIGELSKLILEDGRGRPKNGTNGEPVLSKRSVLSDAGISHTAGVRCELLATIYAEQTELVEAEIEKARENNKPIRPKDIHRLRRQQDRRMAILEESQSAVTGMPPSIAHQTACEFLESLADESVDLLLTDPPYSTDLESVEVFLDQWLDLALSKLKPSARAYICIGAYPRELHSYLSRLLDHKCGFVLANVLVWTYRNTMGPTPKKDYKLNWQAILYLRGPEAPDLDCLHLTEQFTVQDISAPDGRHANRYYEWQKPDELGRRLVSHSTKPGDLVIDPFAGTGTFLLQAAALGRVGKGCDQDAGNIEIAENRGANAARS